MIALYCGLLVLTAFVLVYWAIGEAPPSCPKCGHETKVVHRSPGCTLCHCPYCGYCYREDTE